MKKFTNQTDIDLPIAVWLANDDYDYQVEPNTISVTTLLKSTRQIVLGLRSTETGLEDISNRIASRKGTAYHDSIESAWKDNYAQSLLDLGYPQRVVDRIRINPTEPEADTIPLYFEQRRSKQVGNWNVSGKFDLCFNGQIQDVKSTGTFKYVKKDFDAYVKQLSIYRWLNQGIVKEDIGKIHFIFTDWSKVSMYQQGYPKSQILSEPLELMSIPATDAFIREKLRDIEKHLNTPEQQLPFCTQKELWQDSPKWKYFSKPDAKRASKVFDNQHEAALHMGQKGVGVIREVPTEPKACRYCGVAGSCSQFKSYVERGILK